MNIHVCKQCGTSFVYCRACVFRPIRYKEMGFCSKECYEASKNVIVSVVEPEITEEIVVVEEPRYIDEVIDDVVPMDEEVSVETEVEIEEIVLDENQTIETVAVADTTIKKETNTYKNKKNKYKVHE